MDQQTLAERFILGEAGAFAEMYKMYRVMLFRYFFFRLYPYLRSASRDEAEDQAEYVLLEAIQKHKEYESNRSPLSYWLRMIAKRRFLNYLKKQRLLRIRPKTPVRPTAEAMQNPSGSYELNGRTVSVYPAAPGLELTDESRSDIERMILDVDFLEKIPAPEIDPNFKILLHELTARLTEREQDILFRTIEGSSDKEIAKEMNLNAGSVPRIKSEARAKLRAARDARPKPLVASLSISKMS